MGASTNIAWKDAGAKAQVKGILEQFGWETEDMGVAAAARAIEPLCMLWCIPGLLKNDWKHAYRVLRPQAPHVPGRPGKPRSYPGSLHSCFIAPTPL